VRNNLQTNIIERKITSFHSVVITTVAGVHAVPVQQPDILRTRNLTVSSSFLEYFIHSSTVIWCRAKPQDFSWKQN